MKGRYYCQEHYPAIGPKGQERLARSRVLIVGCGALGSGLATLLARAGVGFIRLVDRDLLEMHNLQRQVLYSEKDVSSGLPKAVLAERRLGEINSTVRVESVAGEFGPGNALDLSADVDLMLDGVDNIATRYLMDEVSVETGRPWIHGGAVGSRGNIMTFIPGETPCFHCLFPEPDSPADMRTCETAGILGPAALTVASVEAAEAIKLLVGDRGALLPGMLNLDLWEGTFRVVDVRGARLPECPCCGRRQFRHLLRS